MKLEPTEQSASPAPRDEILGDVPGERWTLWMDADGTLHANEITPTWGGGVVVVREQEMRRLVKAASCRCVAQIAAQRIENRQRAALSKLFRMDLPPEAAQIVAQALYDQGHPEPSPAPFQRSSSS